MGDKTKTIVKIGGREYTMRGFESEEYIHKVAIYVNRKMEEVERCQPNLSTTMTTVLTAINLADETIKLQEQVDELKKEIKELQENMKKSQPPSPVYEMARKGRR